MLKELMEKLIKKENLSNEESTIALSEILSDAEPLQIAAFLALLRAKGESVEEIFSFVLQMREKMIPVPVSYPVLDIVGTGGDGAHTINISTGSAILAASCGVKVAKHGNRSVSSQCGSADVLSAMGISIDMSAERVSHSIESLGIGFMYAPLFHPAMGQVKELRSHLKIRTIFNIIGPLLNPAGADPLMIGVYHPDLMDIVAEVLFRLQIKRGLVFHGNGLDELSCLGETKIIEVGPDGKKYYTVVPEDFELQKCSLQDLQGKNAAYNAELLLKTFRGEPTPIVDTLVLNSGMALYLYGITSTIQEGIQLSKTSLQSKSCITLIEKWKLL